MHDKHEAYAVQRNREIREMLARKRLGEFSRPKLRHAEVHAFEAGDLDRIKFHRYRLPHWELDGACYFVTFRVHRSLGRILLPGDSPERSALDIVESAIWFHAGTRYALDAYVVMPDHVHLILKPGRGWEMRELIRRLKGFSALHLNRLLERRGSVWQLDSFDRIVRSGADWIAKVTYIHENPVRAGLVQTATDYPWSSLATIHQDALER